MAEKAAPASKELKDDRLKNEMLRDQFGKELLRQKNFGSMWGEICKAEVPKTVDEAIELKKRELAEIQQKLGGQKKAESLAYSTAQSIYSECAEKPDPEAGYKAGYRVLRAGI